MSPDSPEARAGYDPRESTMKSQTRYCEETVVKDGQPGACDRPLDEQGYCDRPGDHRED